MNVLTRKYKRWILELAKKQLPFADDSFYKLYYRCDDYWDDERFEELAKQTLIRSLKKKRKN